MRSSTPWHVRLIQWTALAGAALCGPRAHSQTPTATIPAYRYRVLGVFDEASGEPVEGADVIDITSGTKATTTKTGTGSLIFLPDGGSIVRIRKIGYEVQTFAVAISPTDKTPITVLLKPATTLPTVVVKGTASSIPSRLRAFEEHRKSGFGQFITDSVLRRNENSNMAYVMIAHATGLQMVTTATGATLLVSARTPCKGSAFATCKAPNCFVTTYIDGALVFNASMPVTNALDMGRLSPSDFAAAEFYPGGAILPAGLSPTNSQCGTLVLYTRDR